MFFFNRENAFCLLLFVFFYSPFVYAEDDVDFCAKENCIAIKPLSNGNHLVSCKNEMAGGVGSLIEKIDIPSQVDGHALEHCDLNSDESGISHALAAPSEGNYCVSHTPGNQATNVQVDKSIVIKFGMGSSLLPVSPDNFIVLKNNKSVVPIKLCQVNDLIILKPDSLLDPLSSYTVIINPRMARATKQPISGYSWLFTTAANALPLLDLWEMNMVKFGDKWGRYLESYYPKPFVYNEARGIYYDAQRVYFQISTYTGDREPWEGYAEESERIYRTYLDSRKWITQGWRKFPHGFYLDWVRRGSQSDKEALLALRDNKVFHNPEASTRGKWYWSNLSREIAYALEANVFAERAGYARNTVRVPLYVDMALNHINEWVTGDRGNPDASKHRFAPFMAGLTAEALISFYEWEVEQGHRPGETIPRALRSLADFLWTSEVVGGPNAGKRMWVEDIGGRRPLWTDEGGFGYGAFRYEDRERSKNSTRPAPDLSLLIAPLYAWLFKHYGDSVYIKRGDLIWEGGVALTNAGWNTKIFNQNYRWSFNYVKWRGEGNNQ